jgi:hypothetical protein
VIGVDLLVAALLLTLLLVRGRDQVWLIFAVLSAKGIAYVLLDAGESALLPAALPPSVLGDVNGWRSSAQEGMKLIAPLAGAGLYAWQGGGTVAVLSAAMPILAAGLYAALRLDRPPVETGRARPQLRTILQDGRIRTPVLVAAIAIGMSGFATTSVYARVTTGLGLPATFLGVLGTAQGAGSILGGLVVGRIIAHRGARTTAAIGAVVFGAGCLSQCLPWWPAVVAGSVVIGIGLPWTLVAGVTAVQIHTPDHLLGRVSATATMVMFGPIALTNPLGAAVVHLGPRVALVAAAVVCAAVAVAVVMTRPTYPSGRTQKMVGSSTP